jgi:hypothetical protein
MPVISVRIDDADGPVAREATTADFGASSSRLIIPVHGCSNSKSRALESYSAIPGKQRARQSAGRRRQLSSRRLQMVVSEVLFLIRYFVKKGGKR